MAEKIWTAAELEKLSPAERREISRAAIVWDLDEAPPELVARARKAARKHIAANEQTPSP